MSATTTIEAAEYAYLQAFMRERSAIVLDPGKEYLVESRLMPLVYNEGLATVGELLVRLRQGKPESLRRKILDAMTNNETWFFRDFYPFEALRQEILPALMKARAGTRSVRFWSAAASSGQEAYSIAMLLRENFALPGWKFSILATDISSAVLARAAEGRFSRMEVNRGLPASMLTKYFVKRRAGLATGVIGSRDGRISRLQPRRAVVQHSEDGRGVPAECDDLFRGGNQEADSGAAALGTPAGQRFVSRLRGNHPQYRCRFRASPVRKDGILQVTFMSAEMLTGDDVVRVVREIWEYMLMLPLAPLAGADWEEEPGIVACVQIVGAWHGGVCLSFSTGLASLSAAALTGVEEAEVTREQARDAAGELANIAAGSIKLLLPGPSYLSLPVAASGSDYSLVIKGGRRLLHSVFGYGQERLSVAIIERSEASGTIDLIAMQSRQIQ